MVAFPLIQVYGQYIDKCAFIELIVDTPYVEGAPLEPACYYKKVPVYFAATSDTLPSLFYAAEFTLTGDITNGKIVDISENFSANTSINYDAEGFDLVFNNPLNPITLTESILGVSEE
ncbi:MAG: hypothetical protein DHS20C18_04230 [Saprospiraceae bacterium]|nr:MAG: hypothetical protein DHS20C18_04230 [Saprospiraceae bacterium]